MTSNKYYSTFSLWAITVILTLLSIFYQRRTGPTYPIRGKIEIDGQPIKYQLLRAHETTTDAAYAIAVPDSNIKAIFQYRRYKSHDGWTIDTLKTADKKISLTIPKQPAAGKVIYEITLIDRNNQKYPLTDEPVIIRFKGAVPGYFLLPHILFMFIAMLLSTRTGLEAIAQRKNTFRFALWTTGLLLIGGLILGPIVQKFAFGAFWTGWPFGHDLTDNKTLVAFIFWGIALWRGRHAGKGRVWYIIAAIVTLLVYLVPHSVLGSEVDYTAME